MARILVLMHHKENRRLLSEVLSQYHEVLVPDSEEA